MTPPLKSLARLPLQSRRLRPLLSPAYRRVFGRVKGRRRLFEGVYADFPSAAQAIPRGRLVGYDNEPSSWRVSDARHYLSPYDYPLLFWLERLIAPGMTVFDWGGNVGVSYYAFRRVLKFPDRFEWVVCDVPAVVDLGERIASTEGDARLSFTTDLKRLASADVLLSAGALQFIEAPFDSLRRAEALPPHVLLNKLPVYEQPPAVTLHNMGTSICLYHLFNRALFTGGFRELGYELVDSWTNPGLGCFIPFHPEHSIEAYSGFHFHAAAHAGPH